MSLTAIETRYPEWESALGLQPSIFPILCDHKNPMIDCIRCDAEYQIPHPAVLIGRIEAQVSSLPDSPTKDRITSLLAVLQRAVLQRDLEASLRYIERQMADGDRRFVEERCAL